MLFSNTWVLVTGASSGIGEQFARVLAKRGANLILTARSGATLERLAVEISAGRNIEVRSIAEDLSAPGGAHDLCRKVDELGVFVEHLINNAGFGDAGRFVCADAEKLAAMVRLNCESLTVLSRHFLPAMVARRRGGVIHVASIASYQPLPFMATYAATKAFVLSLSVALSEELRQSGVRVCALCPGPVPTGFQRAAGIQAGVERIAIVHKEAVVDQALRAYEAGRSISVPGAVSTFTTAVSGLLPQRLVARTAAAAMRRMGRDRRRE